MKSLNILYLNSSPRKNGNTVRVLTLLQEALTFAMDQVSIDRVNTGNPQIQGISKNHTQENSKKQHFPSHPLSTRSAGLEKGL